MVIGIPKEIKPNEYRVAAVPENVNQFVLDGHRVLVETSAGAGSGFSDEEYCLSGAEIVGKDELFSESEMIYKVKEFFPEEFHYFHEGQIVFTYIHSNAHPEQTEAMLESRIVGIAYEDIELHGKFPLLSPMSEIAGKGGFLAACRYMQNTEGGPGLLMSGVAGQKNATVAIIGAGISGFAAAQLATALGNRVLLLDINITSLQNARSLLQGNLETLYSTGENIQYAVRECDVLINCINWPKWRTDHLVTREMIRSMKPTAMIVDVACDESGAIETCVATTHDDPVYTDEGIVHYCVDNIPSAYARSASIALSSATLPYARKIANFGVKEALLHDAALRSGLGFYYGELTLEETGRKQNRPYTTPEEALSRMV